MLYMGYVALQQPTLITLRSFFLLQTDKKSETFVDTKALVYSLCVSPHCTHMWSPPPVLPANSRLASCKRDCYLNNLGAFPSHNLPEEKTLAAGPPPHTCPISKMKMRISELCSGIIENGETVSRRALR